MKVLTKLPSWVWPMILVKNPHDSGFFLIVPVLLGGVLIAPANVDKKLLLYSTDSLVNSM